MMLHRWMIGILLVACFAMLPAAGGADESPAEPLPPPGFIALFNGKDLAGWKGLGHVDPAKYRALSPEKRKSLDEKNRAAFTKHWRAEKGELVNDGKGPYSTGPIQLQTHGGEIRWRNVFLREIPREQQSPSPQEPD